jgi:hypothetical protein
VSIEDFRLGTAHAIAPQPTTHKETAVRNAFVALVAAFLLGSCAHLEGLPVVQPPTFQVAGDRQAQLQLLGPGLDRPLGGARVRLWARVQNPNRLGITLNTLNGALFLEGQRATVVEFPLGLPLLAAQDTVIPFDIVLGFADVPNLGPALLQALNRGDAQYRLEGQLRVDAGLLGQPTFGPMTFIEGAVPIFR